MLEYKNFKGIYLRAEENVIKEAEISISGLVVAWASIPGVFLISLIFYIIARLPRYIRMVFSRTVKKAILNTFDVSTIKEDDIAGNMSEQIFGSIPDAVLLLLKISVILLVVAWLGCCLVMTYRHFRYCLAITDFRVIGKANGKELSSPHNEVVNVFFEQSLWGKLFNYGNITVHTKKCSLTFRNIKDPKDIHYMLMKFAENYCAH